MKLFIAVVALFCIVIVNAQPYHATHLGGRRQDWPPRSTGPTFPQIPKDTFPQRYRREAMPQHQGQGSINLEAIQPLGGPDRHPMINLDYNHRIYQDRNANIDAYGGGTYYRGHVDPHLGFKAEKNFGNGGFMHGYGQMQPGPNGRIDPSFGVGGGFRF